MEKEIDFDDLKTDVLEEYSDSRFAIQMPFNYKQLYAAMDEYSDRKAALMSQPKEVEQNEWISVATPVETAMFWVKVKQTDYCWLWKGATNNSGYGVFRHNKETLAHRLAYQLINGGIDNDLQVLHKCDNPICVNPDHLFTGTHSDNMKDKMRKGRTKIMGRSSRYHGVSFRKDNNRWRCFIKKNGKMIYLGNFITETEAAMNRDKYIIDNKLKRPLNFSYPLPPTKQKQ